MATFAEFRKTIPATAPSVASAPVPASTGSFAAFRQANGAAPAAPTTLGGQAWDVTKKVAGPPLRWAGKQLMKPVGTIAVTAENLYQASQGDISQIANIPKDAWGIVSGKTERSFSDIARENMPNNPVGATSLGLLADILLDPTTYLSFGLTAEGKIAARAAKILAAGGKIEAGSKLSADIAKTGKTVDELVDTARAATGAERAAKGQQTILKAGIPFTNIEKSLVSPATSAKFLASTARAGEAIKALPVVGAAITKGRNLFNTTTGNPAADALFTRARSEADYGTMKVMEEAIKTEKQMVKAAVSEEAKIQVANYLEKGIIPENTVLRDIAIRHKPMYAKMFNEAKAAGIAVGKHSFYFPHIEVKAPKTVGEKAQSFLSPKTYTTRVGAVEPRDIMKFQDEQGRNIIGTAKQLGMQALPNVKGLSHEITWGQFKSLKHIEDMLRHYGIDIQYKPQSRVGRGGDAVGYFSPPLRKIVIASQRPTVAQVVATLKHELTHSAHFQLGGNIEMYETFAKAGHSEKMLMALTAAKAAVREEWKKIVGTVEGFTPEQFNSLPANIQKYYTEPTELLARVGDYMHRGPTYREIAMEQFPKSVAAFEEMMKTNKIFNLLSTAVPEQGRNIVGQVYRYKNSNSLFQAIATGAEKASVAEINKAFGKPMFETSPSLAYAYRGIANAKAVASANLFKDIKQFAVAAGEGGVEVKVPELKGLLFPPEIASKLDEYHKAIQPETISAAVRAFDSVQNWWKSQALVSPGYHLRNSIGNLWNNFLAGVPLKNYKDALLVQKGKAFAFIDDAGKKWTSPEILAAAEKNGVIGRGQFIADIPQHIAGEVGAGNLNPFSQQNMLFRGNRAVGGAIENNARLANFMHQLKKGLPPVDSAMEVKKYLFDYADLTPFEQEGLKRLMPFYTFTRKNLPLQLENLIKQPGKYATLEKAVDAIESVGMEGRPPANEKYLSDYIKSNTSMRVKYNPADKSYSYFLLGNWLPAYQMMDFLATPPDSIWQMFTPLFKSPVDLWSNKSSFWKDSLGEYQAIENYPGEQVNFMGVNMPKKTALIFSNITMLNNMDKWNPGGIWGGTPSQKSIWAKAGIPAGNVPGLGNLSPAQFKYNPTTTSVPSELDRFLAFATGKLTTYKPNISREYFNRETDRRASEYKTAITKAQKSRDTARVKLLQEQLQDFLKERGR